MSQSDQRDVAKCLFCDSEQALQPGCTKRRWMVCDIHFMVPCPACGRAAFWMENTKKGSRYTCFSLECNWTGNVPPRSNNGYTGQWVAERWEIRCGDTEWSRAARRLGELGGTVIWYDGYPASEPDIPLNFICVLPDGRKLSGKSRLVDLRFAVAWAESMSNGNKAKIGG